MLYRCTEYHIQVNMYYVSAQGVDEHAIRVHYYIINLQIWVDLQMSVEKLLADFNSHSALA